MCAIVESTVATDAIQAPRSTGVRSPVAPGAPASHGWRSDLAAAWRALLLSRLVVWAAGLGAVAVWGVSATARLAFDPGGVTRPFGALGDLLVGPAARWDAVWFLNIAHDGYAAQADRAAFFPLYPLLSDGVGRVIASPLLAGLLISLATGLAGLAALHRLAVLEVGEAAARWTVIALALFPGSLWFSAVYSESLFLAVSVGAVLAARQGRWAWAAVLGVLATATRSAGLLLLVPLALLWLDAWRGGQARGRDALWLAAVPAGLLAFCVFLAHDGIGFTAPFHAQETWNRSFGGPWAGVQDGAVAAWQGLRQMIHGAAPPVYFPAAAGDPVEVGRHNVMLFAFLALALPAVVGAVRRLHPAHSAYALVALALPLSYPVGPQPLMSLPRFEAVLYPLFLWLGWWLARGPAWRRAVVLGLFALGLAAFSALFTTWHWVA
jgi:hypothetical protein